MPRHILVTGAYGFIGRHVARAFARRGDHVIGIGHGAWDRAEWSMWGIAEWHAADVTLETLVTFAGGPEVVVHCAGSGSVPFSLARPAQDFQRTVETTLAVVEFIRLHHPATRLVLPSSAGVYGDVAVQPIAVDTPLHPRSPYGLHKKMSEELCQSAGRHHGIRSAIVRLFSIYGVGLRKQLLWDACRKLGAGETSFGGTGAETRDWLHADDAADLLVAAADHASPDVPVVNGGSGRAVTVREVVEALAADLGIAARPSFTGLVRAGDPLHFEADVTGARSFGWEPRQHWRDGMRAYAAWFRAGAP